ncbi:MAG: hypothetical protein IJB70_01260 [Clostridia bacterium]|nr:hypothetical protein [Clostridia bacterium]
MNRKYLTIKIIAIITTIAAIVLSFFGWVKVDTQKDVTLANQFSLMNLSDIFTEKHDDGTSFLEDWSFQTYEGYRESLQTAPDKDASNALIKQLDSDITTLVLVILVPCASVKFLLLLSVGFALYGLFRCFVFGKRNRFIMSAQIISLIIQLIVYIVLVIFNFVDISFQSISLNEVGKLMPTLWMILATVMSASSLALSHIYQKQYLQ